MKKFIIKKVKKFLKELVEEMLLEIIRNRIGTLRNIFKDNQDKYDERQSVLMTAKMQALEEAHVVLMSALDG